MGLNMHKNERVLGFLGAILSLACCTKSEKRTGNMFKGLGKT